MAYEFIQIKALGWDRYIKEINNVFDLCGFIMIFLLCIIYQVESPESHHLERWNTTYIEFFALLLVMARGFMHLNAFDITRALIFIMRETLKDMVAFLLILLLSVAALSILNMIAL